PAAKGAVRAECRTDDLGEPAPAGDVAAIDDVARAVRVVQREDRGLREDVGRSQAGRVFGVTLELGRPPHVVLGQQRHADAALRHGRREVEGPARHEVFGLPHVGDEQFLGLARTGADAGQGERGAHQLEEISPARRVGELGGLCGKLPFDVLAEVRGVGQFLEAAPIGAARQTSQSRANVGELHVFIGSSVMRRLPVALGPRNSYLWQTEQLVMCSAPAMLYSALSFNPSAIWSAGGSYCMLKTS